MTNSSDFIVAKMYQELKPPESHLAVLEMPARSVNRNSNIPYVFSDENFAYSTVAARVKKTRPTPAQEKKAQEVADGKKQREELKILKAKQQEKEKEEKK